jgi:PIN domain nuclease of toxin-antitoxin system
MKYLLDTHVLLWWFDDGGRLSAGQKRILSRVDPEHPLHLSDISLWEIATLHERKRVSFTIPLREWLDRATAAPLVQRHGISPAVAAEMQSLPPAFPRDPADRIIVSTARVIGATLLTCDRAIIRCGAVAVVR